MVRVLELRTPLSYVVLALAFLAGCSSSGTDTFVTALRDDLTGNTKAEPAKNPATTISRAQIDALGVAMLRVQATDETQPNLLVAFRKSDAQVTYVLRSDRRLVLHGGLVQSTEGFGDNLAPIAVRANDPIAYPRPLKNWPERIVRTYTRTDRGPGEPVAVQCRYQRGATGTIEIVERRSSVQTVRETCSGGGLDFTNRYDVDVQTGAIWRSIQWSGQQQGSLTIEVLEPLTDG